MLCWFFPNRECARKVVMARKWIIGQLIAWLTVAVMPLPVMAIELELTVSVPHPDAEGGLATNRLRLGMLDTATDGFDPVVDLEAFPSPALTAAIRHLDYAPAQGMLWWDIRSATFPQAWQVEVNSDQATAVVTVRGTPPATMADGCSRTRWTLRDLQSGQTIDLTSGPTTYSYDNSSGVTRRFEVAAAEELATAPLAPVNLWSPRQGRASVYLAWSGAGDSTVRYHVYRETGQGTARLTSTPVATTSYVDTGVDRTSLVTYRVSAVTESGCESGLSTALAVAPHR